MNAQAYYTQQSVMSDPGEYAVLFDTVPDDVAGICKVVQGLVVHYFAAGIQFPPDRLCEIDTRYVAAMLKRISDMDDRPITEARPIKERLVGCCRDFTLLTVAMLRHKGIPARSRYGTGAYFEDGYYCDHVIVEYWNGDRWVGVDSQMDENEIRKLGIQFDAMDVPDDQFVRGGQGWLMARRGEADPDRFGLGSQSPIRGWGIMVTELLLDVAALNRVEMLCWDTWGIAGKFGDLTDENRERLDQVAEMTMDNDRFEEWQTLFADEQFRLPSSVQSWSPAVSHEQMPIEVEISV